LITTGRFYLFDPVSIPRRLRHESNVTLGHADQARLSNVGIFMGEYTTVYLWIRYPRTEFFFGLGSFGIGIRWFG